MKSFLIIADDFTGAADTGVQLARRGIAVNVALRGSGETEPGGSLVLDTETRGMAGGEARAAVLDKLKDIDFSQFDFVVKKVDSTLRGNIAAEVAAVDELFQSELALFIPAFPDMRRTTEGGVQLLNGVRIMETELARDPVKPAMDDNLLNILDAAYGGGAALIGPDDMTHGTTDFACVRAAAADAVSNADMESVASAVLALGRKTLWIGTAAIVDRLLDLGEKPAPALALIASVSETTARQVRHAERYGVELIPVDACELLGGGGEDYVRRAVQAFCADRDAMLVSTAALDRAELERAGQAGDALGMDGAMVAAVVREKMGGLAVQILSEAKVSGVFLSGGDTAAGFLESAGARGAAVTGEMAFGIPMLRLVGGPFDGLKAITKAGAFGAEDALLYALRKLKER